MNERMFEMDKESKGQVKLLDQNQRNEIITTIKYTNVSFGTLGLFYDVRSLMSEKLLNNEEGFDAVNFTVGKEQGVIKKLSKAKLGDSRIINCTEENSTMVEAVDSFLKSIKVTGTALENKVILGQALDCQVYLELPRGNRLTIGNASLNSGAEFVVQNKYNIYNTEGFTLAFVTDAWKVAIVPEAKDGMKGSGEVYVYVAEGGMVRRYLASSFFDVTPILMMYKG